MSLSTVKWRSLAEIYEHELESHGSCSERRLASLSGVSKNTARKSITSFREGNIVHTPCSCGHGYRVLGKLSGLEACHHAYIYKLYTDNPARPLDGYAEELYIKYGLIVSVQLLSNWFK